MNVTVIGATGRTGRLVLAASAAATRSWTAATSRSDAVAGSSGPMRIP